LLDPQTPQSILRDSTPAVRFETVPVLGPGSSALSGFGLARRQPLSFILDQLVHRLQEYLATPFTNRQDAVDGLAICGFACVFLGESLEFAPERLRILQLCTRRGLEWIAMADEARVRENQDDEVVEPLKELVVSCSHAFLLYHG